MFQMKKRSKAQLRWRQRTLGGIDILVNNAGTSSAARFEDMTNEQLDIDFSLKVKGAIYMTRYALPYHQGNPIAVQFATQPRRAAKPQPAEVNRLRCPAPQVYLLTKAWSKEFGDYGIRVNTVCVGVLKSRQHRIRWEAANAADSSYSLDDHWATFGAGVPLGRIGEAKEAGDVIAFLCSPAASYVSGAAVNVDGGAAPVY